VRLIISRRKDRSILRVSSLVLDARAELQVDELQLIDSFKAHSIVLHSEGENHNQSITIGNLLKGISYKCSTINDIVKKEAMIRVACRSLKAHLHVMANFEKETIEEV
jgi:hypothetical protein